jgi:Fe-S cluster assembly protein SufD
MARTRTEPTGASDSNLAELAAATPAAEVLWLQRLRKAALQRFETIGLPTPQDEDWRLTNLAPIAATRFIRPDSTPRLNASDLEPLGFAGLDCPRIVLVNGRFDQSLSNLDDLPRGVRVESLAQALASRPQELEALIGSVASHESRAFTALNAAAFEDGTVVTVSKGVAAEVPVHILHLTVAGDEHPAIQPRTLVVAGESSQAAIVESYLAVGDGVYLTNAVTEIVLGENAVLDHVRIQGESKNAFHIGAVQVRQARNSNYTNHNVSFGSALARHDIGSVLDGEGAEATLNGLYLTSGSQRVHNHTVLDHAKPHCPSHELYKGILAGRSQAVFNGRIIVRQDAQKTDAKQSNKSMLLSNEALIHTRPQLEIYADDVKCTHGATIGHLEDEALFYMRARGIGLSEARSILILGFISDIVDRISYRPLREQLVERAATMVLGELLPGEQA